MKWAGLSSLIFGLILCSCTTEPAKLTLSTADISASGARIKASVKQVCLLQIEDQRTNSESLGQVAGRPFHADDLTAWIVQSFNDLAPERYVISEKVSKDEAPLAIKVIVLKAYVSNILSSKTAVIVLKLECCSKDKPASEPVIIRGQYAGPNWASTTSEVQGALQNALKQCMQQVLSQIDACFSKDKCSP